MHMNVVILRGASMRNFFEKKTFLIYDCRTAIWRDSVAISKQKVCPQGGKNCVTGGDCVREVNVFLTIFSFFFVISNISKLFKYVSEKCE